MRRFIVMAGGADAITKPPLQIPNPRAPFDGELDQIESIFVIRVP
jgi:hypothetical protein